MSTFHETHGLYIQASADGQPSCPGTGRNARSVSRRSTPKAAQLSALSAPRNGEPDITFTSNSNGTVSSTVPSPVSVGLLHSTSENVQRRKRVLKLRGLYMALADAEPRPTPTEPHRVPTTRAAEAIELYQTGISTTQVARQLGVSRTTVAGWIKDEGIPMRHSPITDEQLTIARRLREQGQSYATIARQIGYTASGVRRRLLEIVE